MICVKPMAKILTSAALTMALCSVVVFCQRPETKSEPSQAVSSIDAAEESRLSASLDELYKLGKFEQALPVAMRLLELREKMFGPADPLVALALSDLAEIHRARNKYDQAQPLYRRSLTILERNPTVNPQLLSNTLENLANIVFAKRNYKEASSLLERAVTVKEVAVGKEDPSLTPLLHHLANVYHVQRKFEQAESTYLRSITLAEQRLGRRHPETISAMKDYGCLNLRSSGPIPNPPKAEEMDPSEKAKNALKNRAGCWLSGFKEDCDVDPPAPSQEPEQVLNGRALVLPKPDYPQGARAARASGTVFVALRIDGKGNVTDAKTVCGGPLLLLDSALTAARGAKFSPTIVNGKPTQVFGIITYNFVAQ